MAEVWANSMACHPRATNHIAGCCHLVNSLSRFQSHMPHCRVQSPGEINFTLQSVRIPSAILKMVFRHILFFVLFLMQLRLWRAAAFVLSPIHLFVAGKWHPDCDRRIHIQQFACGQTVTKTLLYSMDWQTFSVTCSLNECVCVCVRERVWMLFRYSHMFFIH